MKHRLAHLFGLTAGTVYSWYCPDTGYLMIGFKCSVCGSINGVHKSVTGDKSWWRKHIGQQITD